MNLFVFEQDSCGLSNHKHQTFQFVCLDSCASWTNWFIVTPHVPWKLFSSCSLIFSQWLLIPSLTVVFPNIFIRAASFYWHNFHINVTISRFSCLWFYAAIPKYNFQDLPLHNKNIAFCFKQCNWICRNCFSC